VTALRALRALAGALVEATRLVMLVAFLAMVALTLFQVLNRYVLGWPVFWTEELIVLLLVWSMLLGLPVQLWRREEIVVDVLPLPGAAGRVKLALALGCSVAFCLLLAWSGWSFAERGLIARSPALGLSRVWFFVPIPLAAALSALVLLVRPPPAPDDPGAVEA
jgi:TRAP-type C4-dicarboxylate transport system permease small subunit